MYASCHAVCNHKTACYMYVGMTLYSHYTFCVACTCTVLYVILQIIIEVFLCNVDHIDH